MSDVDRYLEAATRDNTRRSYQSAIRHFEVEWGGFLPASADAIARYLAEHAGSLSLNTLRARLAALGQWHQTPGISRPDQSAARVQGPQGHCRAASDDREARQALAARPA
ncbi:hypothetical protein [Ralstonia pickettii]|jgi:hypothetical protein|uniref:hypothetical protein n=1 Tax=Ralstonia pickettii TaxID=329 RepID=UPI002115D2C0|nr:hypothetical protein [Ralstonia pickettii]